MKEITRISLASLPYNIEVEAKKKLENYLQAVERSLAADVDAMKEIEARIAEILSERGVVDEKVIAFADVEAVMEQLGEPKEFVDEEELGQEVKSEAPKRLMRDSANAVIGGVASGMAAYFKLDVVLMRIIWIVAIFATAGAAIPLYILMWIIVPKATTAADRLQMAGEPVTLASLKQESTADLKPSRSAELVGLALRLFFGIGLAFTAIGATLMMFGIGWSVTVGDGPRLTSELLLPFGLMVAAGITFVIFCATLAYMVIAKKFARRLVLAIVGMIIVGITLFTASVGIMAVGYRYEADRLEKSDVAKTIDASAIEGAKQLTLDSENVLVNYVVSTDPPKAELRYSTFMTGETPSIELSRNGDTLVVKAISTPPYRCVGVCDNSVMLTLYGPALDVVTTNNSLNYDAVVEQASLTVNAQRGSRVSIYGSKHIAQLNANIEEAQFDTVGGNIGNVNLKADSSSGVSLGNVGVVEVTAPQTCPSNGGLDLTISAAQSVTINGAAVTESNLREPCFRFQLENNVQD